ncbi:MAG: hypothetical protein KBD78_11990 [Oligoflexales bacterium]|nr:hypothetical protein [Oligoflexales bacterium]
MKKVNKKDFLSLKKSMLFLFMLFHSLFNTAICRDIGTGKSISDLDLQATALREQVNALSSLNNENSYSLGREYVNKSLIRGIEEYSSSLFQSSAYSLKYFLEFSHRPSIEQLIAAHYYLVLTTEKMGSSEETITQALIFFSIFNGLSDKKIAESAKKIDHIFELALSHVYAHNYELMDLYFIYQHLEKAQHIVLSSQLHNRGRFLVASIALQSKYKKNEKILDELYGNDHKNDEYLFLKSQFYVRSGKYAEALRILTSLLDSSHEEPFKNLLFISLARTHFILKNYSESIYFYSLITSESFLKSRALYESIFAAIKSNDKTKAIAISDDYLNKFQKDRNYSKVKSIKEQINIQGHDLAGFREQSHANFNDSKKLFATYLSDDSILLNKESVYDFVNATESTFLLPDDYRFIKNVLDKRNALIEIDGKLLFELSLTIKKFIEAEGGQHMPHINTMLNRADEFLGKYMALVERAVLLNKNLTAPLISLEQETKYNILIKRLEDIKNRLFKKKNSILSQRKIVGRTAARIVYKEIFDRINLVNAEIIGPAKVLNISMPNDVTEARKKLRDHIVETHEDISLELLDAKNYWYLDDLLKQELEVLSLTLDEIKVISNEKKTGEIRTLNSRGAIDNLYRSLDESENALRIFLEALSQRTEKFYSSVREKTAEIRSMRQNLNTGILKLNTRLDSLLKENHARNFALAFREFANQSTQSRRLSADALLLEVELDEEKFENEDQRLKNLELENKEVSKRRKLGL